MLHSLERSFNCISLVDSSGSDHTTMNKLHSTSNTCNSTNHSFILSQETTTTTSAITSNTPSTTSTNATEATDLGHSPISPISSLSSPLALSPAVTPLEQAYESTIHIQILRQEDEDIEHLPQIMIASQL